MSPPEEMNLVACPFCGFEFEPEDTLCTHGCPLHSMCTLIRCPSCDYEFPEDTPKISFWKRLFGRRRKKSEGLPDKVTTVRDLQGGQEARVVCLAGDSDSRRNALAVFGLVPGSEIRLIQRHPAFVIQVGETDLALDPAIAGEIVVESPPGS